MNEENFKVELVGYEDLTKEQQIQQPNNGNGREYANYIKVTHNGKVIDILSDAVEPEDATFIRDFSDVVDMIREAYQLGFEDGKKAEVKVELEDKAQDNSSVLSLIEQLKSVNDRVFAVSADCPICRCRNEFIMKNESKISTPIICKLCSHIYSYDKSPYGRIERSNKITEWKESEGE